MVQFLLDRKNNLLTEVKVRDSRAKYFYGDLVYINESMNVCVSMLELRLKLHLRVAFVSLHLHNVS